VSATDPTLLARNNLSVQLQHEVAALDQKRNFETVLECSMSTIFIGPNLWINYKLEDTRLTVKLGPSAHL
jgi:hypothetical protein